MKMLLAVFYTFLIQKCGACDRWLCVNLPWYIRIYWCSLWVRHDTSHPSLNSDLDALFYKIQFRRKLLKMWLNITRLRPTPSMEDAAKEFLRLKELGERLYVEYTSNLVQRQNAARGRTGTPSLS